MEISDAMVEAGLNACSLSYFKQNISRSEGAHYLRCSISSDDVRAVLHAALAATIRREAPDWQPMETAPHGRWVLLDMSYLYPSDTHITEIYTVGCWTDKHEDYCWDCGEDVHHRDAPKGWMDIPKTKLANPPGEQP